MTLTLETPVTDYALRPDYLERVYAGVLGKIIGVYLGRPFEQWRWDRIERELGEIWYYVHEKLGVPLIVTDDDITGTFTFLRAMPDYGNTLSLTPAQIGQTWLNYIIERRTILWWGGIGNSTEHTAYQRLKEGVPAPQSGSIALNGTTVAEQIGAQIFIDGWGMIAPGNPALAADLARRAGSVSHDGEAIYGAQVIAAIESAAFIESDINRLLDIAVSLIPADSVIARLIADLRTFHATHADWRAARDLVYDRYSYERYPGNCHMVPNHALIILALLYGEDDFQKTQMIVNTCGYDTDCNAGNVGCIMGIKNGLTGIDNGPDWRGPVADRLYLSSADGGRGISDAVAEALHIANIGRALAGGVSVAPKDGARFHFELPGSVQGFVADDAPDARGVLQLVNVAGHSLTGSRSLAFQFDRLAPGRAARAGTTTFMAPAALNMIGYQLFASPTVYSGQTLQAQVSTADSNPQPVTARLYLDVYVGANGLTRVYGDAQPLPPGAQAELSWRVPNTDGQPIAQVGLELRAERMTSGVVYLDFLKIEGTPNTIFTRPPEVTVQRYSEVQQAWRRAWVDALDQWEPRWQNAFHIVQNSGRGLLSIGTHDWQDYTVAATINSEFASAIGLAARVNGLTRFYAALLSSDGKIQIVKAMDGDAVLAEAAFVWENGRNYAVEVMVSGATISVTVDGQSLLTATDTDRPLLNGGVGLVVENGFLVTHAVQVR